MAAKMAGEMGEVCHQRIKKLGPIKFKTFPITYKEGKRCTWFKRSNKSVQNQKF